MQRRHRSPTPLRVVDVDLEGEQFVVVSFPLPSSGVVASLSAAEREVAQLAAEGYSNKSIAERRDTTVRTVANQLASCMRKLGVGSRVEIAAALACSTGERAR